MDVQGAHCLAPFQEAGDTVSGTCCHHVCAALWSVHLSCSLDKELVVFERITFCKLCGYASKSDCGAGLHEVL